MAIPLVKCNFHFPSPLCDTIHAKIACHNKILKEKHLQKGSEKYWKTHRLRSGKVFLEG